MRLRAIACLAALVPIFCVAQTRVHMRILINGSPVGENTYEKGADGAFSSKSSLDLGSIKLSGTVTGHLKDGKLIDSSAETQSISGSSKVVFANGKVTVTAQGKTNSAPYQDKTGALLGNLHPQLDASSLLIASKAILANPATKTTVVNAFFVDGGIVIPFKVTMQQPKLVTVEGKRISARRFATELAGIPIEMLLDDQGNVAAQDVPSQHLRFVEDGWENAFEDPMAKFPELSQATFKTKTEKGVHMKARDGVDLVCDVVRPDDGDKHPAILVRTPYGRGAETANGMFYATRGYAYVTQDCRGREDSSGEWDPFIHEGPDGYDTIQWIAGQDWSNGKVGMIGGSYDGYVQWAAAVENPPALKCIVPQVSPPDGMRNLPYDHGTFALYPNIWWAKIVAGKHTDFSSLKGSLPHPEKLGTLPLSEVDRAVLGKHLDFFQKWLDRPTIGNWKGWDFTYHLSNVTIPAIHISGTWDGDEIGTHINWSTMRRLKRDNQWIVFGPWVHAFNSNHSLGDEEYGPTAIIDLDSVFLRWFDTWLKDKDVGLNHVPHVRLFVTGANKWITLPDWPAPSTPGRTLYLTKAGLRKTAGPSQSARYTYDPAKNTLIPKEFIHTAEAAPTTKVQPYEIKGGLVLKTPVLTKDTAIAAPIDIHLYFSTSARDTDFYGFVIDIAPDGQARIVGQPGKIRGSYLSGMDAVRPLTAGKQYLAEIEPWDFAHEFKKGHRIGLVINSTMFPYFARNLGTAEPIKNATRMMVQKNKILMGKGHPSSVTFHVLWEK